MQADDDAHQTLPAKGDEDASADGRRGSVDRVGKGLVERDGKGYVAVQTHPISLELHCKEDYVAPEV